MTIGYENLISSLIKDGYLKTQDIIAGFKAIDRADFVLDEHRADAYANTPLPIGFNQTISQPLTVAFMIELLEPKQGEKILEIGAGSGWQTAILAYLASKKSPDSSAAAASEVETGEVPKAGIIAIERIPELEEMTRRNLAKYDFLIRGTVRIIRGDGSRGYKKEAPYDKIIAGAASAGDIPLAWRKQLRIGGRIVSPVGQSIHVIDKISKNEFAQKEYFGFSFVPLIME